MCACMAKMLKARYYHASYLPDISFPAQDKILSCKLLARYIFPCSRQDIIMQATCQIYLSLLKARYYHASYLPDISFPAKGKILSCKLLARYIFPCSRQDIIMQATCQIYLSCTRLRYYHASYLHNSFKKTGAWIILERYLKDMFDWGIV